MPPRLKKKNIVVIKSNGKCAVNIAAALELSVSSDKNFILLKVFEGKIFRTDDNPAAQKVNFIQAQISKSCEDGDCFVSISSGDKLTKTYTIEKNKSADISGLQFKIPSPLKYELDKDSWLTIHIETQDNKGKGSCYAHSKNYIGEDLTKMIFGK